MAKQTQSESILWHEHRVGRVKASKGHSILHTNMSNPSKSLIKTICSPTVEQLKTPAILWGKAHENDAIAVYYHFKKNKSDAGNPF